jgi:hypothetical protein
MTAVESCGKSGSFFSFSPNCISHTLYKTCATRSHAFYFILGRLSTCFLPRRPSGGFSDEQCTREAGGDGLISMKHIIVTFLVVLLFSLLFVLIDVFILFCWRKRKF